MQASAASTYIGSRQTSMMLPGTARWSILLGLAVATAGADRSR
eukprot:SAG31_NODE_19476_length_600_cov_1.536926_2_plen_42_part_01